MSKEKSLPRGERRPVGSILPKSSVYALLIGLVILALALRYPPTEHEIGVDSYTIQGLADMTVRTGRVGWLIAPLSYFGLAPFSYSPVVPISLAGFQSLAGTNSELTVLLFSLLLGAVLPLTSFLLGLAAFRRPSMGLLVSFLISTAGGMVGFTTWTAASRGVFLTMTPLALALFVRTILSESRTSTHGIALLLVLAILFFTHAMFTLFVPIIVGAYVVYRITAIEERLLVHKRDARWRTRIAFLTAITIGSSFAVLLALGPASDTFTGFPAPRVKWLPDTLPIRMGLQWATLMGLGILFLPLGAIRLLRTVDRRRRFTLLALSLMFLPLALNPIYGLLLAMPVVLLLAAMGLDPQRFPIRRKASGKGNPSVLITAIACVSIAIAPVLVTIPRTSDVPCNEPGYLDSQTYNTGLYLRYSTISSGNFSFVWDDHIEAERLETISGRPALEPLLSMGDLAYPWLSAKMKVRFEQNTQIVDFFLSNHQIISAQEWLPLADSGYPYFWGKHTFVLLQNQPDSPTSRQILEFYRATVAVERCGTNRTAFFDALHNDDYVLYADELQRAYWLGGYPNS